MAKKRSSRGLLIRLILDSNISTDVPAPSTSHQVALTEMEAAMALENTIHENKYDRAQNGTDSLNDISFNETELMKLKEKIKSEVKEEILSEMKNKMKAINSAVIDLTVKGESSRYEDPRCEEDSDSNMVGGNEDRALKYFPYLPYQKKLEKKEKHFDTKIDQRLEKLELKKKKLLEKASFRTAVNRKASSVVSKIGVPCIMSALQTTESSTLAKRVTMGKAFLHVWHILNDGTLTWTNVELRHTWSSPGLEPDELSVKCPPVAPGQEAQVAVKFKTPKIVGAFISYWHLFYQADTHWQQFGHYISVSGYSKLPKQDVAKKSKQESSVTAKESTRKDSTIGSRNRKFSSICNKETDKEMFVAPSTCNVGEDSNMCELQRQATKNLEASLASAQIAADMAREAAKAAFRQATGLADRGGKLMTGDNTTTNGLDKLDKTNGMEL
ncbi:hypothetical protein J6590_038479 [Homalodisca vitripennis]|nr:hypothetical protein J6590_038479 [Homalodisca vitripennis]